MTERLFEIGPYIQEFEATVTECVEKKGIYHIGLDRSAFFPEGGGQPGDRGWLDDVRVLDTHEKEGTIWHYTEKPLMKGQKVQGKLNWSLRFSNMQNHAGEHIVSGIIHRRFGYDNVGFHMGTDAISLDINGELTAEQVRLIEIEANEAIEANLPIIIQTPEKKAQDAMSYRSKKEIEGDVRIVEIPGYDLCACCGTHPFRTGEIRMIKILSVQNYKGGVRISMLAGNRAMEDYRKKHDSVVEISHLLSAKTGEVSEGVERLLKEIGDLKYSMMQMKREYMAVKAQNAELEDGSICVMENALKGNDLREYASLLSKRVDRVLALSENGDSQMNYVLIDLGGQAKNLGQEIRQFFDGKGGGQSQMIQGTLKGDYFSVKQWFENHE